MDKKQNSKRKASLACVVCVLAFLWTHTGCTAFQQDSNTIHPAKSLPSTTPWDLIALSRPPEYQWADQESPVWSLHYEGEVYKGNPTRVFAYYASPVTLEVESKADKSFPAVVLVHGGGGMAFEEWAEMWAKRGYAAIAMDLGGCGPERRKRLVDGGPGQSDKEKFQAIDQPVEDQWTYHAVANVILAHSLIRSFKAVDASRTAITGISWGGYLTCIVAGLDSRFKAAVPVYGCGFLHENSMWLKNFEAMTPQQKDKWVHLWDPSMYVGSATMPMFFINGTNDGAYPLDSYARTYGLVNGKRNFRITVNMRHGHQPGWAPEEIGLFVDQYLKGGTPLPEVMAPEISHGEIRTRFESKIALTSANLHYATGTTPINELDWETLPARIEDNMIVSPLPPDEATLWFLTVADSRQGIVSSELVFATGNWASAKPRLIILADMGNEPDEMQQMIHMISCSNEFELEGLIAVTGKYLRPGSRLGEYNWVTHPELYIEIIDAYAKVYKNLQNHADGWPEPDALKKIVAAGQKEYGIADVKAGNSSPGSELIIRALSKDDDRPVWVVVNAGANTLAQALVDYRANHTAQELEQFVARCRVFENGSQDNAGAWICSQFPAIHWIRSNFQTYAYGGPSRENLGPHAWQPYANSTQGQLDWQKEYIMNGHGALGELYPPRLFHAWGEGVINFMEGGGTIPWMGLVNKGLFDIDQPSWGGWSGRFSAKKTKNFWSRHKDIRQDEQAVAPFYTHSEVSDTWTDPHSGITYSDNYVPVWRWREAMYNDFKCRMDWCVQPYDKANHHPVAALGSDRTDSIIRMTAAPGETIDLDASASTDPDKDVLSIRWWQYQEAGTYAGQVHIPSPNKAKTQLTIPTGAGGKQLHIILEIKDNNPIVPLFDYRRLVIDVTSG
ncbi:nucleoside hydrolase-like domain-containing protein [Planctomycetota bacterium]